MVYIQSNTTTNLPHHFDAACALYGAMDSGLDYRLVTFEDVAIGKYDALIRNNLFVGSVEFMREVFKRIGKTDVRLPINSPQQHEIITLQEARERVNGGQNLFIKPVEIKLFTGFVLDGMDYTCLHGLSDDTKVIVSPPFKDKILSEWRAYIHNGKVVDIRNYSGDFSEYPNIRTIEIRDINELLIGKFPIAYTVDVAILYSDSLPANTKQVVVEFNDMWAIGNYGMPNDLYLKLLKDRYFEIVKN